MAVSHAGPRPGARGGAARSVVLSPLLNLAPGPASAAAMRHCVPLVPLGGSAIRGKALLSLDPERRSIEVTLRLDPPAAAEIRLRRIEAGGGGDEEDLLIVEVVASRFPVPCLGRRFSLEHRGSCKAFEDRGQLRGICLSALRADSVEGIAVAPARSRPAGDGASAHLGEGMRREIAAAEGSASAAAASRHVELATLYARRLRAGSSASR